MLSMNGGNQIEFSSDDVVERIEGDDANIYTRKLLDELRGLQNSAMQRRNAGVDVEEGQRLDAEVRMWKRGIELIEELWPLIHGNGY